MRRLAATGLLLAATLPALGQTATAPVALRGSQDAGSGLALPRPAIGLPAKQLGLNPLDEVARIAATPTLDRLLTLPDQERSPLLSGDPTASGRATATFGSPVLITDPASPRRRRLADVDPYAAVGVPFGSLALVPSIEIDSGYDDNPDRTSGDRKGSGFTTLSGHVEATSDWSRDSLRGSLDASLTRYWSDETFRPRVAGVLSRQIDVSRRTSLDVEVRGNIDTELSSLDLTPSSDSERKLTLAYGAAAGGTQRFGDVVLGLHALADRNQYEVLSRDRDYTTPGANARVSYDPGGAVAPFVEATWDRRIHDNGTAADGTRRDSTGITADAGASVTLPGRLTGEAAVGYGTRLYQDDMLPDLSGALVRAALIWTPSALTTVGLRAATDYNETVQVGSSGAVARTVGLDVSHALRRNLIVSASLAETVADYAGLDRHDDTTQATVGLEYKLNRALSVRASYAYERVGSNVAGLDTTDNTVFLGVKMQR